jgi:hypothetical protein
MLIQICVICEPVTHQRESVANKMSKANSKIQNLSPKTL